MKLALGTAQFGLDYGISNTAGMVSQSEAVKILELAQRHGINMLDTAAAYGKSESVLGKVNLANWLVVTKLPPRKSIDKDVGNWTISSIVQSCVNLRRDSIYGVLLHRPSQLFENNGELIYSALKKLQQEGVVSKIGVSVYDPLELDKLFGNFDFDLVQAPFSVIDRRLIATGWMDKLVNKGVELHVRSVFLQGLLLMREGERPEKFHRWNKVWRNWHDWLAESKLTAIEACVRYVLSHSEIERAVVGVQSSNQLEEIVVASRKAGIDAPLYLGVDFEELINPARWEISV